MAKKREYIDKRVITFKNSDSPLTSKRVSIILSNPIDSAKLAGAVRALRHNDKKNSFFRLEKETLESIKKEQQRLENA